MGIYDRDYYRREGPSFLAAMTERGKVCKWLILINVIMFVLQLFTPPPVVERVPYNHRDFEQPSRSEPAPRPSSGFITDFFELQTSKVLHGEVWRLLSFAFLHDPHNFYHILFNMLFLWWFGTDVEDLYGPREFLAIYLTSAVLGGLAFVGGNLLDFPPGDVSCVGASGAITTVIILCAMHYPRRIIYLFFFLPVPIWLFAVFIVGKDAYTLISGEATQTAVTVHLAGAGFAYVYFKLQMNLVGFLPSLNRKSFRRKPPLRIYREDEPIHAQPVAVASPPVSRDLVD
jgi:membrane associated rhomboid family serine protease